MTNTKKNWGLCPTQEAVLSPVYKKGETEAWSNLISFLTQADSGDLR